MKVITLWQPYASAIAVGLKRFETRGWKTNYRGPLAIHAAKRWTGAEREEWELTRIRYGKLPEEAPRGRIVAVCDLAEVYTTDEVRVTGSEAALGDYSPGRYAWELMNVQALPEPLKLRGQQGLATLDPHIEDRIRERMIV